MTVLALLDRAATMQHSFFRDVSSLSLFNGLECAKVNLGVVMRYACSKSRAIFENSKNARRFVALLCFSLVLNILLLRDVAQVFKTIVRSVSVYVVNMTLRPVSRHVKPSQSMTAVKSVVDGCDKIAMACNAA